MNKWNPPTPPVLQAETKEALQKLKSLQGAYQEVFNSINGQIVFNDLMKEAGIDRTIFSKLGTEQMIYNAGKQHIGYYLKQILFSNLELKG
jgi:hypothetical protein